MSDFRYPLTKPPRGAITLAIARHRSSVATGPLFSAYVQDRHDLVHELVDSQQHIEVINWGTGDHLGPGNEVWELIIGGIGAMAALIQAAPVIAGWLGPARRSERHGSPTVRSIKMKRPDGAEIEIGLGAGSTSENAVDLIRAFLAPVAE